MKVYKCTDLDQKEDKASKVPKKTSVKRSASDSEETPFKAPELLQTPKRRKKEPIISSKLPPSTPTPAAVTALSQTSTNPRRKPAGGTRKAAPNNTNAPLQTPGGTKVVKYPSDVFDSALSSPHKAAEPGTTTENLLEKACAHLVSMDPKLQAVIDKHHCKMFSPEGLQEVVEPFTALSSGIMAQQVLAPNQAPLDDSVIDRNTGLRRSSLLHKEQIQLPLHPTT